MKLQVFLNPKIALFCHSGESRNPGKTSSSRPRLSPGWRLSWLFTKSSDFMAKFLVRSNWSPRGPAAGLY